MKNKLTVIVSVAMSLLMILSVLTACSFGKKGENAEDSTTLSPEEEWHPGANETYEPVDIEAVELVAIVSEALGDEASSFTGDLDSLTSEQLQKVKQVAENKGYVVETGSSGETVIKKDSNVKVTGASPEKTDEILSRAGVENTTALSKEDYRKISQVAEERGATAVTDSRGNVTIVETSVAPVTRPSSTAPGSTASPSRTTATTATTAGRTNSRDVSRTADRNPAPNTSASYTTVTTSKKYSITNISGAVANTYNSKNNCNFKADIAVKDGVIAAGTVSEDPKGKGTGYSNAIVAKFSSKGKKDWSTVLPADDYTEFENIAVLADGSIVAVGHTMAENITNDSGYKCKGTVEGVIAKFSSGGKLQALKLFGGSGGDLIYAIAPTSDGGFVIGGKTESSDFDLKGVSTEKIKGYVAKFDQNMSLQWVKALSGSKHTSVMDLAVTSSDTIYAVIETIAKDGDFAGMEGAKNGKTYSVIEKLDISGNVLWTKEFYESGKVALNSVTAANDNGCVVAGTYSTDKSGNKGSFKSLYNGGGTDGIVIKINAVGNVSWMLPLIGFQDDTVSGIAPINGGYAVSGYTTSTNRDFAVINQGDSDSFVAAVSENGKLVFLKSFGGSLADRAMNICSDGTGTVYACGLTYSADADFAEVDNKGNSETAMGFIYKYDIASE